MVQNDKALTWRARSSAELTAEAQYSPVLLLPAKVKQQQTPAVVMLLSSRLEIRGVSIVEVACTPFACSYQVAAVDSCGAYGFLLP